MLKFISEIKNRFFLLSITGFSVFLALYLYKEVLLFIMIRSHILYTLASGVLLPSYFIFTGVTEIFSVYIKLVSFFSLQIIILVLIYHISSFFYPATFQFEYNYIIKMLQMMISLWVFSIFFVSTYLVPLTWDFFLSFPSTTSSFSINLHFEARLSEYLSFYISLYYICIFYSQVFLGLFFFFSYNKVSKHYFKKFRKLYYYCFVLFSTLLCPPDIYSQICVSFFIICLYEVFLLSILFRKFLICQPIKTD